MFKWSKQPYNDRPTTPKLASVCLPMESPVQRSSMPKKPSLSEKPQRNASFFGRFTPDKRPTTPHPVVSAHSRESASSGRVSRMRTVSMSHKVDDEIIKPHKAVAREIPSKPIAVPAVSKGGTYKLEQTETSAGSLKSSMKGGSSHHGSKHETSPSSHVERRSSKHVSPPEHLAANELHHRTRHQSITDRRQSCLASDVTPKYMKAYIKEVPMKGEAVALSWPLVDCASRKHSRKPPLYFDIGFDPRTDGWAIRANRGGYSTQLTREECEIPASPHCEMTEMTITCSVLEQWPVHVRRSKGIRCIDVFRAIYDTYSVVLTAKELVCIGENYISRCEPAFKQRCADSPGLPLYNERCGMRRVDLLRGRRIFKGLTPSQENGSHWILHFDDMQF